MMKRARHRFLIMFWNTMVGRRVGPTVGPFCQFTNSSISKTDGRMTYHPFATIVMISLVGSDVEKGRFGQKLCLSCISHVLTMPFFQYCKRNADVGKVLIIGVSVNTPTTPTTSYMQPSIIYMIQISLMHLELFTDASK
jgi:hypothetical protein